MRGKGKVFTGEFSRNIKKQDLTPKLEIIMGK